MHAATVVGACGFSLVAAEGPASLEILASASRIFSSSTPPFLFSLSAPLLPHFRTREKTLQVSRNKTLVPLPRRRRRRSKKKTSSTASNPRPRPTIAPSSNLDTPTTTHTNTRAERPGACVCCRKRPPRGEAMTLTKQARLRNPDDFPTLQLFLLGKPTMSPFYRSLLADPPCLSHCSPR